MNMRLRDGSLSGKQSARAADKGPERTQNYNGGLSAAR